MLYDTLIPDSAASAIEPTGEPDPIAMLVDLDRRLIDVSGAAGIMLEEGRPLGCSFGKLVANGQCDRGRIDRALSEARRRGFSSMRLGDDRLRADVVRMGTDQAKPRFLILARQRVGHYYGRVESVTRGFGLTPAENRLLEHLLHGRSLKETALQLGVARTTARTHLQRIFDKTGVRRQTDLQRLLAGGAGA